MTQDTHTVLRAALDDLLLDTASAAMVGLGISHAMVDLNAPKAVECVKAYLKSYTAFDSLIAAMEAAEPSQIWCSTCEGGGTVDNTLGGDNINATTHDKCPDCDGLGYWYRVVAQPVEQPALTLDDMTPMQFALTELHKFQEATGCDTADQLNAQPVEQLNEWKEAMLNGLAEHAIDAPISESPRQILARIIDMAVTIATDSSMQPVEQPALTDEQIDVVLAVWFSSELEYGGFRARMRAAIEHAIKGVK
jgi:hypothetical protein